jgi:hypothetical protein
MFLKKIIKKQVLPKHALTFPPRLMVKEYSCFSLNHFKIKLTFKITIKS